MAYLGQHKIQKYLPAIYDFGQARVEKNGQTVSVNAYTSEWLDGFGEIAIRKTAKGEFKFYISYDDHIEALSPEQGNQILAEAAKIYAVYSFMDDLRLMDDLTFLAGDFVGRQTTDGKIELRLITARKRVGTKLNRLLFDALSNAFAFSRISVADENTGLFSKNRNILFVPYLTLLGFWNGMRSLSPDYDWRTLASSLSKTLRQLAFQFAAEFRERGIAGLSDETVAASLWLISELTYYADIRHWSASGPTARSPKDPFARKQTMNGAA